MVFAPSQVICLKGFLVAMRKIALTTDRNNTNGTATEGSSVMKAQAVTWAGSLIVTELISVLLVAWSWSIICRLGCVCIQRR
jgi:hypothetical protein